MQKEKLNLIYEIQQIIDNQLTRFPENLPRPYQEQIVALINASQRLEDLTFIQKTEE